MKLKEYIRLTSPEGASLGLANASLQRLAFRARVSTHMIYEISNGRRHASKTAAERIAAATDNHVQLKDLINDQPRKARRAAASPVSRKGGVPHIR